MTYIKYPRTYHLPWSASKTNDDRTLKNTQHFEGKEVVVTEKLDGENSTLYSDYFHARSLDGNNHWTQNWLKNFHSTFAFEIPDGWRVCGENLYAKHSIEYDNLDSYFYGFSIWNDKNECLSWDDTLEYFDILNIKHVPILYRGLWDENKIRKLNIDEARQEGYAVRLAERFGYFDFKWAVAKYVRKNHISQTVNNWKFGNIKTNKLKL